jgi:hypothetical protein
MRREEDASARDRHGRASIEQSQRRAFANNIDRAELDRYREREVVAEPRHEVLGTGRASGRHAVARRMRCVRPRGDVYSSEGLCEDLETLAKKFLRDATERDDLLERARHARPGLSTGDENARSDHCVDLLPAQQAFVVCALEELLGDVRHCARQLDRVAHCVDVLERRRQVTHVSTRGCVGSQRRSLEVARHTREAVLCAHNRRKLGTSIDKGVRRPTDTRGIRASFVVSKGSPWTQTTCSGKHGQRTERAPRGEILFLKENAALTFAPGVDDPVPKYETWKKGNRVQFRFEREASRERLFSLYAPHEPQIRSPEEYSSTMFGTSSLQFGHINRTARSARKSSLVGAEGLSSKCEARLGNGMNVTAIVAGLFSKDGRKGEKND